jgi:DNA polymerase-3 subunit delta'
MGLPRYYPKHEATIQTLAQQARLPKLLRLWKSLIQARRHENHPLATRIQLEALLSQYQQVFED